eukprot:42771-Eustigmatos_ZCMA.PRE.1
MVKWLGPHRLAVDKLSKHAGAYVGIVTGPTDMWLLCLDHAVTEVSEYVPEGLLFVTDDEPSTHEESRERFQT